MTETSVYVNRITHISSRYAVGSDVCWLIAEWAGHHKSDSGDSVRQSGDKFWQVEENVYTTRHIGPKQGYFLFCVCDVRGLFWSLRFSLNNN